MMQAMAPQQAFIHPFKEIDMGRKKSRKQQAAPVSFEPDV
jgi:5-carboxymethyl-2-hydroxymuconate isomerase